MISLLLLQLLLLQLSISIWRGAVSWHMEKSKMYKFVYSETTGYYINVPVFYTYSVSANKNETFIIEWRHEKWWIFCYLKTQWGLYNIIIFSLNYYCILNRLLKIFCSFLFLPLKGSQEFALSIYVIMIFLEWDFNRSIENLWYSNLQQV